MIHQDIKENGTDKPETMAHLATVNFMDGKMHSLN